MRSITNLNGPGSWIESGNKKQDLGGSKCDETDAEVQNALAVRDSSH